MSDTAFHFEVRRDDLTQHRLLEAPVPEPDDGEAVLRVDHFALTANNITYGAFGEGMGYWNFFPGADGWGRVPVWGFADVAASRADGVPVGQRVYGYLPMSTHLVVQPGRVTPASFVDTAAHRAPLPPVYNQYRRVEAQPDREEQVEEVLRPLFTTSFLIDDWLADQAWFGAGRVVVASASSKTALGLAALLHDRGGVEVVGLTSPANAEFVARVGYYDRAVVYGDVAGLDPAVPTVLVDMGGSSAVLQEVHGHLADSLRHSCMVGATHWRDVRPGVRLPGPAPQLFFAPDHVVRRTREWGGARFEERLGSAWDRFTASTEGWLELVVHQGREAVAPAFAAVRDGAVPPHQGYVISYGG